MLTRLQLRVETQGPSALPSFRWCVWEPASDVFRLPPGHIGPRAPSEDDSPVFGFAGLVLPRASGRGSCKCHLLVELDRARSCSVGEEGVEPLLTNVERYRELRTFTNRMLNKIEAVGGFVLYVGVKKTAPPESHYPNRRRSFSKQSSESIISASSTATRSANFFLALDEHDQRATLITEVSRSMYAGPDRRRHLICSTSRVIAIRPYRPPIGLPGWWGAWVLSGQIRSPTPRTSSSVVISNIGSTAVGGAIRQRLAENAHRGQTVVSESRGHRSRCSRQGSRRSRGALSCPALQFARVHRHPEIGPPPMRKRRFR